ncbi:helix-turn-helix transcriptional regulator [Amycolatopsis sp. WQ 127309]|uniref:helix-turn-helix transcriptional regulator n=1 Tax=Amycolatopsis sp. WQ 127309 TaxID=2932773 RepID=UPI001FF21719|nr:helix-turn-helix transcriptional regulator [Amycolatopsis sp. WQ 127309]UOZ10418.1 helix-turn-helix transcriptional regulator [Amycolatopsis sp. WQ 127309]
MNTLLTQAASLHPVPVHPAARQLLRQVAADPAAPLRIAVVAPGGYGKSVLLAALARAYRDAGADALLVDDADRIDADQLEELLAGADGPIVVAHRPAAVAAGWTLLQLAPFGVDDVARLVEALTGTPAEPAAAAELHRVSGGVPRLAERALLGRLEEFRPELDELDDDVLRYLIAAEAGAGRNLDLLCVLLDRTPDQLPGIVDGARATGLLAPDDTLLPLASAAVRDFGPPARRLTTVQRLVELQLANGLPVLDLARSLLGTGSTGTSAAAAFAAAASEALPTDARLATRLFEAAAEAGDRSASVTAGWARAAALSGDLDTALRLGDGMLGAQDAETRAAGAEIAATVLAHRGELARGAELYQWAALGGQTPGQHAADPYSAGPGPGSPAGWGDPRHSTGHGAGPDSSASYGVDPRHSAAHGADSAGRRADPRYPAVHSAGSDFSASHADPRYPAGRGAEPYYSAARGGPRLSAGRGGTDAFAVMALVGTGDLESARRLLDSPAPGVAPTLFAGAATRMARGIADSVSGCATETLSTLLGAAAMLEPALGGTLLPDSPAALAALAALHTGELALAESVLTRALDGRIGGDLLAVRHRLLLGWVAMTAGDLATAAGHRDAVAGRPLEARDEMFFTTLELGLARRSSDLVGLQRSWDRAYQASMRQQTDLFTLLPLGELVIAAARTGAHAKLAGQLERAHTLLARLGEPPLWTVSLVWHELHAAITLEDAEAAKAHLATLTSHAHCGRHPSALATAARGWLAVLSGTFAPDEISAAAAELHDLGLRWDASRLAGQAAIRTSDRKAMVQLLEAARQFQGTGVRREAGAAEPASSGTGLAALSERELEVARLVVEGLTYKQAGSKLFISSKTVEHHMARIRGKLGASDRRELLATLRELLSRPDAP